jgi:hypothetical protein
MKTPTNRIRQNGSTKAVKSQAQTAPEKTVIVIFYYADDEREFFRVDFPEPLYEAIVRACKKMRITLGRFCEQALERKIGCRMILKELRTPNSHSSCFAGSRSKSVKNKKCPGCA